MKNDDQLDLFGQQPVNGTTRTVPTATITYRDHREAYQSIRLAVENLMRAIAKSHVRGATSLAPDVMAALTHLSAATATPLAPAPLPTVAPDNGTATSQAAAVKISARLASLQMKVLHAVIQAGQTGATDPELEQHLQMKHQTCSARRRELVLAGLVTASPATSSATPPVRDGSQVWVATPDGVAYHAGLRSATTPPPVAPSGPSSAP